MCTWIGLVLGVGVMVLVFVFTNAAGARDPVQVVADSQGVHWGCIAYGLLLAAAVLVLLSVVDVPPISGMLWGN